MQTRLHPLNCAVLGAFVATLAGCEGRSAQPENRAAISKEVGGESAPAASNAASMNGSQPSAVAAASAANAATRNDSTSASNRPSTTDNMGRNFQGRMQLRIAAKGAPDRTLRFMSLGNASRLQAEGPTAFDVLFLDEKLITLNHKDRTYQVKRLADIEGTNAAYDVELQRLETRQTIQQVFCDDWRLRDGASRIDVCVAGLPGEFSVPKFEAATGVSVPNWVKKLFAEEYLPIVARVTDAAGRELYNVKLEEYSPELVDSQLLAIPANYNPR